MFGTSAPSVKIAIAGLLVRKWTRYAELTAIDQYRVFSGSEVVEESLAFIRRRPRMKVTCIDPGLAEIACQLMNMGQVHAKNQCRFSSG